MKMKIQYMSDLHLEFGTMDIPEVIGDVLILAGDIHVGTRGVGWINHASEKFKDVIYVLGNHEFYHNDMFDLPRALKQPSLFNDNVHFLDNDCVTINGIKFAGSTLWSDMTLDAFGSMNDSNLISMPVAKDLYATYSKEAKLNYIKMLHKNAKLFLHNNKDADVVITHHCPHIKSINTNRYPDNSMNTGYYTDILKEFVNSPHVNNGSNIKHWVCGHTHSVVEYEEYGIKVHNNCRGYVGYGNGPDGCEVTHFNKGAYFEV